MEFPFKRHVFRVAAGATALVCLTASCESVKHEPLTEPLRINKPAVIDSASLQDTRRRDHLTSEPGPVTPSGRSAAAPLVSSTPPRLTGEPVSVRFEGIRLAAFINTVFGDVLKVSWEMDSTLAQKDILVTLSTGDTPLPRDAFFRMVTEVLANYGVGVLYSNNVYRVVEATSIKKPIPRIIRSRSGAAVPSDLRPIFYFQSINNIPVATMSAWLDLAMKDRLQTVPLPFANGVLLLGSADDVGSATEIIATLDQPYLAGSQSLKISPAFWSAPKLAQQLVEIMTAEGYSIAIGGATTAAIKLVPVEAQNVIVVFGTGQDALRHVLQWATDLDQPSQTQVSSQGVFYHQIYNAKAADIVNTIQGIAGATAAASASSSSSPAFPSPAATPGMTAPASPASPAAASQGLIPASNSGVSAGRNQRLMVDEARNGIIFVGSAEEYAQFRTLVQQMDRVPLQVMIEATIAEVNLKQGESLGMVFNLDKGAADALNNTTVKSDGTGLFFTLVRDHGTLLSQVNAMANINRLQVLSSPRLVTSSGKPAAINVGTQVPIITSQETAPNGQVAGTSSILQSVQYRSTGITLNVNPTINSSRRVELQIQQEVSDAQQNNVSGVQSPIIINRSLQTTLSLDDGQTALLGGMIAENYSKGDTGIPYLKDIPVLGNLFKNQSSSVQRTELIVLLTPYIIDSTESANQVRDAFRAKLGDWAAPAPETAAPAAKP